MSNADQMPWEKAVLAVFTEGEELHYAEVTARIAEQGLREITGKTPDITVNSYLSDLRKKGLVVKVKPGVFRLRQDGEQIDTAQTEEATTGKKEKDDDDANYITYGRFWRKDMVNWRSKRLWGMHVSNKGAVDTDQLVDFSEQNGIYILHWHGQVMYVGQTNKQGLYYRLNQHRDDARKNPRWDTFSWLGLRRVSEKGALEETIPEMVGDELIDYVEAVLIETLLPPLNRRAGNHFGSMYRQIQLN